MDELLQLARENNRLLKEVRGLLLTMLSDNDFSQQQDMKQFCINVVADIFVSRMGLDAKDSIYDSLVNKG